MKHEVEETGLRAIFASSPDAITVSDLNGNITDCNQAALDMGGFSSKDEVIGKSAFGFIAKKDRERAMKNLKKTLEQDSVKNREYTFLAKDGREYPAELSASVIKDSSGNPTGFVAVTKDITERKKIEEVLEESEEKYRKLFEEALDAIFVADAETGILIDCNRAASELVGREKSELIGKHQRILHPPEEIEGEFSRTFKRHLKEKEGQVLETQVITKKGEIKEVAIKANLFEFRGKKLIQGIFSDITKRKRAEEALRESEEKYRTLMEEVPIGICNVDIKGKVTYVNKRFEEVSGYLREEVVGRNGFKLGMFSDETLKLFAKRIKSTLMGKPARSVEFRFKCKDGRWIWVYMDAKLIKKWGVPVGFQLASRDITERKQAEQALKESEEKYRSMVELAPVAIVNMDLKGVITSCNTFVTLSGYSKDELIGKHFSKLGFFQARDLPKYLKMFSSIIRGKVPEPFEVSYRHRDGEPHVGKTYVSLMKKNGKTIGLQSIVMDITEMKKKERAVHESQEKFERLFMNNPEAADYLDPDFHILNVNPRFEELFGYSLDEVKGKHINDVVVPKDRIEEAEMLDKEAKKGYTHHDAVRKKKDGTLVPVSISAAPIIFEGKLIGTVGLYKDITKQRQMKKKLEAYSEHLEELVKKRTRELRAAQERLIKSERLAAIGEVATMVGHDLRNPLQSIENAAYYLNHELPHLSLSILNHKKAKEMLQIINDSVNYADRIIRDLQDFSATKKPMLKKTNINAIVEETLSQIETPENVHLITALGHLPRIEADKDMIKRGFLNLAVNGIEAMENGGRLKVSTKKTRDFVEVSFEDTGVGMSKEKMEKLFTPFFSTKAKGLGMGLAICKKFVESHDGSIDVESEEGEGSTFTVKLPIR